MFGILSGPFVTIVYLLEQFEVFIFGSTSRCSDWRIVINFVIHVGLSIACYFISLQNKTIWTCIAVAVSGFITSKNTIFSLCIKKPFNVVN
jgi:hypothetical protein